MKPCTLCGSAEHPRHAAIIRRLDARFQGVTRCYDRAACHQRADEAGREWIADDRTAGQLLVNEDVLVELVSQRLRLVH